jgi:predicted O-methyltransferase YrrM
MLGWDDADRDALEVLRPLLDAGGYLPWTEGALRPAALAVVCNEIVLAERVQVAELGSGVSTVILARLLRERGGRLTSLEHDPEWARVTRTQLERERLTDVARLAEAPLEPHPLAMDEAPWYAEAALAELPRPATIDLLLVDGPPGYGEGMELSRYPALPALKEKLAPDAMVILDDAERAGEQAILERWSSEHPAWTFTTRDQGIAVGVRSA